MTFDIQTFTVTASSDTNGSVSPTSQTVNYGNNLTITATPNNGYAVNCWTIGGQPPSSDNGATATVSNNGNSLTLTNITANQTVAVTFIQTFTITPSTGNNGSISPNTVQTVNSGGSVSFTVTPNDGYVVNSWSIDGTVTQTGGTTYVMSNITANHTVTVTFVEVTVSFDDGPYDVWEYTNGSFTATITPADAASKVTYTITNNGDIASVSGSGTSFSIYGDNTGSTTLSAMLGDSVLATTTVMVVELEDDGTSYVGYTLQADFSPTVNPPAAAADIDYMTDNDNIASMQLLGNLWYINGLNPGQGNILAYIGNSENPNPLPLVTVQVTFNNAPYTVLVGDTPQQDTSTISPSSSAAAIQYAPAIFRSPR